MNNGSGIERRLVRVALAVATVLGTQAGWVDTAAAQSEERGVESLQLGEVTVTALRTSTDVQHTPAAVSVLTGEILTSRGVTDVLQLTELTPGLDVSPTSGPYSNFTIRGVNNFAVNYFSEAAVAVNFNGVYMARPTAQHGMFYDIERIEVLKGPQGTLYGRNATGGAINLITRKPDSEFGGHLNAEVGDFDRRVFEGAINVPLGESTAMRFAGQTVDRDGFYSDDTGDEKTRAGRLSLRTGLEGGTSITFVADYAHQSGRGGGTTPLTASGDFVADPWDGLLDPINRPLIRTGPPTNTTFQAPADYFQDNNFGGASIEVEIPISAGIFTILPGYRDVDTEFLNASGGFFVNERSRSHQPSFEARFASNDERALRYLAGVYYFGEDVEGSGFFDQSAQGVNNQQFQLSTDSYAGFGRLIWAAADTFRVSGSVRYTYEEKQADGRTFNIQPRFVPPAPPPVFPGTPVLTLNDASKSYSATTWTGGVEWDVADQSLLYANVGRGFKAGGFFSAPAGINTYDPERVTSYTLGSKNRFLANRLQLNAEVFYLDYKDQQISHLDRRIVPGTTTSLTVQVTENIGQATTKGVELEMEYLAMANTSISTAVQYLDATYDELRFRSPQLGPAPPPYGCPFNASDGFYNIDCSGRRATQSPEWVADLAVEQRFPLSNGAAIIANLSSRYEDERETRINYLPQSLVDDYTRTNFSIGYRATDVWSVSAFVQNIEDDEVPAQTFVHANYPTVNLVTASLKPPRTYGVRFSYEY